VFGYVPFFFEQNYSGVVLVGQPEGCGGA